MLYDNLDDGYVDTSFGRLHYKQNQGNGPATLFLHGIGANMRAWKRLVEALPEGFGVCLLDLLGHGDSDAPEMEYKVSTQASAVKEFMQKKGIEDACLFGHSYGGWIAALIAQESLKLKGIVLEDTAGLKESFDDIAKEGSWEKKKEELIREALLTNPREYVVKSTVESTALGEYLTRESLLGITRPALIAWGSEDKSLDVKYAKILAAYIQGSKLEIIEGAGHYPHFTNPDKVSALLLRFISR